MPFIFEGCVRVADRCCGLILLMQHFYFLVLSNYCFIGRLVRSVYPVELIMERGRHYESTKLQVVTMPELFDMNPHLNMV
jgi:hypothetical protein